MDSQQLADLWTEITEDPLERGYSGMTDEEIAADLNTEYRTRNLARISGDEAFAATDATEFGNLGDTQEERSHKQVLWLSFCGRTSIDPFGSANVSLVQWVFGGGSVTISNLADIRTEPCSRAVELGLGEVAVGHIENARALYGG